MIPSFRNLRIAAKLLLTVLPLVAISVVGLFWGAEHWMQQQRLAELTNRVDAYAETQGALLVRHLWEFEEPTVIRLVNSSARMPDISLIQVREVTGRVVASREDKWTGGPNKLFRIERPLVHHSNNQAYVIGNLIIEYHDGPLRHDLAEYRLISGAVLLLALLLLSGVTILGVGRFIGMPLERLRRSLENNTAFGSRERLVWSGNDELGAVADAYNGLLDEVEQRTDELTNANLALSGERSELLLAASVFENTIEGIVVVDAAGIILSVNTAFCTITGYAVPDVVGQQFQRFQSDANEPAFYAAIRHALTHHRHWEGEVWSRRKDGTPFLGWATLSLIPEDAERVKGGGSGRRYLAVFNDITELRRKDEHIHHLAYHDPLTGLPNRRLLQDRLNHAVAVAERHAQSLALIFIDVDQFKTINDSLGHEVGDTLLELVAERLVGSVRSMDTVCRWGGDEFVVMIENCQGIEDVRQVADKILSSLSGPMDLHVATIHSSVSLGISLFPQDGNEPTLLMRNADAALYEAKIAGRNRYHFFDESMNLRLRQRLEMESELREALDRGQLELHYQPKFSISGKRLSGLEALVRWRHPEKGLIPPSDFIPLAEDTGLVIPIGEWVLRETCRQIKSWTAQGYDVVQVAVNLSARHVSDPKLVEQVCAIVEKENVDPTLIEIEVTETAVMKDPEQAIALLGLLRDKGFGIAVDDFGTGYSSLSYLGRLPITTLKIDRSFVINMENSADDAEIVRTIIAMAKALDLKLVAEGVETEQQMAFLGELSCDVIQGYFIARPLVPKMVEAWLDRVPAVSLAG
ncbi:MAG: EAL domain-containing protein [Rhodospirillaceae bacterium]|nr:EAL domain-containing protein [Rhodospirillales bacterium]